MKTKTNKENKKEGNCLDFKLKSLIEKLKSKEIMEVLKRLSQK